MAIQTCANCGVELQKAKKATSEYLVWSVDHYEPSDVEVFINCPNCGEYLNNEDFE